MQWSDEFSVGIFEIDEQHKILVQCISDLELAVSSRERWPAIHSTLVRLADYVRTHFTVEESLMSILGYPGEEHIEQHRRFASRLDELKAKALSADISGEALQFLTGWLSGHIVESDKKGYAAEFLKRQAAPAAGEPGARRSFGRFASLSSTLRRLCMASRRVFTSLNSEVFTTYSGLDFRYI